MNYREEQWLLQTTRENNKMLKYIVGIVNNITSNSSKDEVKDFMRNLAANLISNKFELNK